MECMTTDIPVTDPGDAVNSDSEATVGCMKCWKNTNYDQVSDFMWRYNIWRFGILLCVFHVHVDSQ